MVALDNQVTINYGLYKDWIMIIQYPCLDY